MAKYMNQMMRIVRRLDNKVVVPRTMVIVSFYIYKENDLC